ncbi:hypothetical protein [Rhodophyticola porphyridii]|uniref:hypothetical protein n=1 Tax=Rhodophyticola porphyridii TaxID=1852017 RepID=UPI0035D08311
MSGTEADLDNLAQPVDASPVLRIVERLKDRGASYERRANLIFRALVLTILVGLLYYLGLPFWSQFVDGRRETFLDTQQSIDAGNAALDTERAVQSRQLADALAARPVATLLRGPLMSPAGHVRTTGGTVFYGRSDRLAFLPDGADSLREIRVEERFGGPLQGFSNHVEFAGQTVLFGNARGALVFRNDPAQAEPVFFPGPPQNEDSPFHLTGSLVSESTLYLFGNDGTILWTQAPRDWFERFETGTTDTIVGGHLDAGVPVFAGPAGRLFRIDEDAAGRPRIDALEIDLDGPVTVAVDAPAGWLLLSGQGQGYVLLSARGGTIESGSLPPETAGECCGADAVVMGERVYALVNNAVVTSRNGGVSFEASAEIGNLPNTILATPQAVVVYSGQVNPAYRSVDALRGFGPAPGAPSIYYGHLVFEDTVILHGAAGSIARSADGGRTFETIDDILDDYLYGNATDGTAFVLFGGNGSAAYASTPSAPVQAIALPLVADAERTTQFTYGGGLSLGDGDFLIYGEDGFIRIDWRWRDAFAALDLPPGAAGDIALAGFIDRLPNQVRGLADISELRQAVGVITAQRDVLTDLQVSTDAELQRLNDFPHSLLLLERQRESFAGFMATCRGATNWATPPEPRGIAEADADTITLACLQGWEAQVRADQPSPWSLVAAQLPPGILLLFLLATLSGLYRYNLRLAGFHYSRADTLVMAMDQEGGLNAETLLKYADALAADKVEFGKGNLPSDQAAAIVQAVANRS